MSPQNMAASVKARLQNVARKSGTAYNELLPRYVMERFLYRLSKSKHADQFVLKGALLFAVWEPEYQRRTTMDIDLLGFVDNSLETLESITRELCQMDVEDDGIRFDSEDIKVERVKEDADYEGVRVLTFAYLERSRVRLQVDVGFGDALVPDAISASLPAILDFPAPTLRCYHQLTVIAEKFEAMIKLGSLNSRMKDFYDVWNLIQHEEIDGQELQAACVATFQHRETPLNHVHDYFRGEFIVSEEKETQWKAFLRKQKLMEVAPAGFQDVISQLQAFFLPMVEQENAGKTLSLQWKQGWK